MVPTTISGKLSRGRQSVAVELYIENRSFGLLPTFAGASCAIAKAADPFMYVSYLVERQASKEFWRRWYLLCSIREWVEWLPAEVRSTQGEQARWAMSMGTIRCERSPIDSCSNQIKGRIDWCRCQQLKTVTQDERDGWRAEEAGLMDALLGRDMTAFMKVKNRSQLPRYLCGLHDGQTLLSLQDPKPLGG
jgi:hypothetical protein